MADGTTPVVTVVMAARNAQAHIGEAIGSLQRQSLRDFELIVIDDGSSDATADIVLSLVDSRIRLLRMPEGVGAAAARNLGIRQARSALIAVLDADDIALPDRLQRQAKYLDEHRGCGLLGTAYRVIDDTGAVQRTVTPPRKTGTIRWRLLTRNIIANSTVMFRKAEVVALGGFDERFKAGHDYALWSALAPRTMVTHLPEALVGYRVNPRGLTANARSSQRAAEVAVSREALCRLLGRDIDTDIVETIRSAIPARGEDCARRCQAATVLGEALLAFTEEDSTVRGCEMDLLRDWRMLVGRLCAPCPSGVPCLVLNSIRVSYSVRGIWGVASARHVAWALRVSARSVQASLVPR